MTMSQAGAIASSGQNVAMRPQTQNNVRARRGSATPRTWLTPYLFLLPYFLVTCVFFLYPLAYATVLAFYQTSGPGHREYVGWDNFRFVLRDPDFRTALGNTLIFTLCSIIIQLPLSLALAMLLNSKTGRLKGIF